jgi:hypothetical protein
LAHPGPGGATCADQGDSWAGWDGFSSGKGGYLFKSSAAPAIFQKKPFGENIEGLSRCGDESYSSMSVFK